MAARVIATDCTAKEAQATQIASARRLQVAGVFAGMRAGVAAFLGSVIAGFTSQVVTRQAQLLVAVASVLATAQGLVAGLVGAVLAGAARVTAAITSLVDGALSGVRSRVQSVAAQITGLISSVSLPDIPGVATIRARAVAFLNQAAGVVTSALDGVASAVRSMAQAAMVLVTSLVLGALALVQQAMGAVAATLLRVVQGAAAVLLRLVVMVGTVLRTLLAVTVLPLLARVEVFIVGRIAAARQLVVAQLRLSRDLHLEALQEPAPGAAGPTGATSSDASDEAEIVEDALRTSTRIVRLFDLASGAGLRAGVAVVAGIATRIYAAIRARVAAVVAQVVAAVQAVLNALRQVLAAVRMVVESVLRAVVDGITRVVDLLRQAVQHPLDAVVRFAAGAVGRVRDFVVSFVRNLVAGIVRVISDVRSVVTGGTTSLPAESLESSFPLSGGPITKPSPGGIVLPILTGLFFVFAAIGFIVLATFPALAPVVAFLLALGLGEVTILVIVGAVALLLAVLVLVLVLVLIKLLLRRRKPRTKIVLATTPAKTEVGVGGPTVGVTATLSRIAALKWSINPGGTVPAGLSILGTARTVRLNAAHPAPGTVTGGTPVVVRAEAAADPTDFADTAGIMVVQVTEVHYDSVPPLTTIPPMPRTPPANTGEPNRDGVTGNTVTVVTTTAPAGRAPRVTLRTSLGATVAGTTITPATRTGDIAVRITDPASGAILDETRPSLLNPPTLMAVLIVNAVPTRVSSLTNLTSGLGLYSAINQIGFDSSDAVHLPLTRIIGELITLVRDDFNVAPPNAAHGGFNNVFIPALSAPADFWRDQLVLPANEPIVGVVPARPAVDVNRFVGAGVPQLPRQLVFRQRMVWARWLSPGTPVSRPLADGRHIKTLSGAPPTFQFQIKHTFGGIVSTAPADPYAGPALIVLTNIVVTPTAPGARALAADGVATADAVLTTTVPGRPVSWTVTSGDVTIPSGNPSVPPGAATIQAGSTTGRKNLRAEDATHANRRVLGGVTVAAVALRNIRAAQRVVPPGTNTVTVSVDAEPGGRVVEWNVDATSVVAGITVTPGRTGPAAPPMSVTVTRPASFTGNVTVTATDSVLAARSARVRISFT